MDDVATLIDCATRASNIVRHTVGFYDEDLAADAVEAMVQALASYDPDAGATLHTWLWDKARYRVLDRYRDRVGRHWRKPVHVELIEGEHDQVRVDAGFDAVDDRLTAERTVASLRLDELLDALPERDATIIDLVLAGEAQTEVADLFGITASRVCQIVSRFKDTVRAA